jgi:hypothetical protein
MFVQFIPVQRNNPEVIADIEAPKEVKQILKRACYDCHSNETQWPVYGYVAPVSWFINRDIKKGREYLNFSDWENYQIEKKEELRKEMHEEIEEHEMPLRRYVLMHKEAGLSTADMQILTAWIEKRF